MKTHAGSRIVRPLKNACSLKKHFVDVIDNIVAQWPALENDEYEKQAIVVRF